MKTGTTFQPLIATTLDGAAIAFGGFNHEIESVVLCSGKVYYDAIAAVATHRSKKSPSSVAIVRVEELAPFPMTSLISFLSR